jgi:uncharacterized RDD family membrane protein YckC
MPAGLLPRLLAFAWDYLPIAAWLALVVGAGAALQALAPEPAAAAAFGAPGRGQLLGFLLVTLPVGLYFALSEASAAQGTWGKRRMRLRVQTAGGARLTLPRSLLRTGLKLAPWELAHACLWQIRFASPGSEGAAEIGLALVWGLVGLNLVSWLVSPRRLTLYDRTAGTEVLADPKPPGAP